MASSRHESAKKLVEGWLVEAKKGCSVDPENYQYERALLEALINVKAAGFRGIVLTAIVGKSLDSTYNPTNDFYASSPRTLFEKGIYYALQENRVPCGKSDPLNVAKNARVIDKTWAAGRRPESAALAAVEYIQLIQDHWQDEQKRKDLIVLFFSRLWQYAEMLMEADVPLAAFEGTAPVILARKLVNFTLNFPEGGATPQLVVGTLIELLRAGDPLYRSVEGAHESVFGTNTTSKKPADVWEVLNDGTIGELYEITAKIVDKKRLDDCVDALKALDLGGRIVTFICRIPTDISSLAVVENTLMHKDAMFQFLDLAGFIETVFCTLPISKQAEAIEAVDKFTKDVNRKIEVKNAWAELFG